MKFDELFKGGARLGCDVSAHNLADLLPVPLSYAGVGEGLQNWHVLLEVFDLVLGLVLMGKKCICFY